MSQKAGRDVEYAEFSPTYLRVSASTSILKCGESLASEDHTCPSDGTSDEGWQAGDHRERGTGDDTLLVGLFGKTFLTGNTMGELLELIFE